MILNENIFFLNQVEVGFLSKLLRVVQRFFTDLVISKDL